MIGASNGGNGNLGVIVGYGAGTMTVGNATPVAACRFILSA
jgi:hypothetical protein